MLNVNNSNSRIALSTSVNFQDKILGENITKKTKVPSKNFQKLVKIVNFTYITSEYIIKVYVNPN